MGLFAGSQDFGAADPLRGTPRAFEREMHTVIFSIKRADQRLIAFQRELLEPYGITPARYLMMFVIWKSGGQVGSSNWLFQSVLRRKLGVTAATVSKMLRALEETHFVKRTYQYANDRRQVVVQLTQKALCLLGRVEREVIEPGKVWFALHTILGMTGKEVDVIKHLMDVLRRGLHDGAKFFFQWCDRTLYPETYASTHAVGP